MCDKMSIIFRALTCLCLVAQFAKSTAVASFNWVGVSCNNLYLEYQWSVTLGTLAGLIAPAYPKRSLLLLFFGLIIAGALIEAVQAIPMIGRTASFEDWVADILAAGLVLISVGLLRKLRLGSAI